MPSSSSGAVRAGSWHAMSPPGAVKGSRCDTRDPADGPAPLPWLRGRAGTEFSRAVAGQRVYFGQRRDLCRAREEERSDPAAASRGRSPGTRWLWMQRAALQSGQARSAELSAEQCSPRNRGCRSGDPPVQRGLANERGCSGAAAYSMQSAGIVFPAPRLGFIPAIAMYYLTRRCFGEGAGQSIPSSGFCLASEQSIAVVPTLRPCAAAVAFPGRALIPGSRPSAKLLFTPAAGDLIIIS